jgi:hypothetical protein
MAVSPNPYKVVTRINDVVYSILRNATLRIMVVHLDQLAPYVGSTWDEQPLGGSSKSSCRVIIMKTVP